MNTEQAIKALRQFQLETDAAFIICHDQFNIRIADAEKKMREAMQTIAGHNVRWLEGYADIADWLSDNHGKGLLVMGGVGVGKTLLTAKVIPVLLMCENPMKVYNVYSAWDMNRKSQAMAKEQVLFLDDIGVENILNDFGSKSMVFRELVDIAERKGTCLIMNTNLNIGELNTKYGERTIDRLRSLVKIAVLNESSMRGLSAENP